jgi:histidinol-phosphatase
MNGRRILFLDRDGTLNEETPDEQIDVLEKIRLMPGVVPALLGLKAAGFAFVMVTNQDGLGTASFPQENFDRVHRFILELFSSQGIEFEAVCICPHYLREDCACRKPRIGMVREFLAAHIIDNGIRGEFGGTGIADTLGRRRARDLARHRAAHHRTGAPLPGAPQDQGDRHPHRSRFVA